MEGVEFDELLRARRMTVEVDGWVASAYGVSSLSVRDPEGKLVYHTVARDDNLCTKEGLTRLIKDVM